ncbi:Phosphoenolpyruvate-protein phosphotransferase [Limihaloglobus sulfuriphilus]|uniref:Phosphoenolpyruvate-protein phosphotransferase n=1 Tax=Limihaloglobus sulfuriphilus TaxID=1851148 RepID=A0A1Q2MHY7_9BACT|nr:phosphoenolpyruvate--protein phosphotransferase [Limihaloglobus sulfuriphilus]AQQ71872.1 Phosphoenolpyruvate-protein phosphotransferase [Limihaloglobus sulfuriphilus]
MKVIKGIAVSPGIAIADAIVLDSGEIRIPRRRITEAIVREEQDKVRSAFASAVLELRNFQNSPDVHEKNVRDIFASHKAFLKDRVLRKRINERVRNELVTAEYAISSVMRELAEYFSSLKDVYIRQRASDIYSLERRVLKYLIDAVQQDIQTVSKDTVIVAHDLTPSQTVSLNREFVKGFATDVGGRTSHTAIVARALGIPAVVALEHITDFAEPGVTVIIDGNRGYAIVDPDEKTLLEYRGLAKDMKRLKKQFAALKDKEAVTRDGVKITILGNIELPDEAELVLKNGGEGIGLYRTEFLYLKDGREPSVQDQLRAYKEVSRIMGSRPVVIRTMDLGADKVVLGGEEFTHEHNPVLGFKSIRFCLENMDMFKNQLRAILLASGCGTISVMIPMVTNLYEVRQTKMLLRDVMEDLAEEGISYNSDIKFGAMIETPSAAIMSDRLCRNVDFVSIGTNDLIQYTLAVDRANERVATLYNPGDPAVLRLLRLSVDNVLAAGCGLSVCGEMASDPEFIFFLLGIGVRTLSIAPAMIPEIKKVILSVSIEECRRLAEEARDMCFPAQVSNHFRAAAMKILPETY